MYVITTAGFEKGYPCFEMEARVKRILEGAEEDDTLFGILYTLDEGDAWDDKSTWVKANPNLDVSIFMKNLEDDFKEAFSMPSKQNNFRTKHLNEWTEAETRWITMDAWKLNSDPVDADGLAGRACFTALDLSTTIDLTAWVLCFPPSGEGDKYQFLYRFFIPQEGIHERTQKEKFDYETMVRNGFITATPGNVVDYDFIKAQIYEDVKRYDVKELAYDPWNATSIITDIQNEIGATCVEFRQGFATMSPACKDFERKVLSGRLAAGGNPVMNWMIGCTEVTSDPAGNIKLVKPDRQRTGKHIDGVVASVMALNRATKNEGDDGPSIYETEELLIL
jgi:phage terminase large subunit-like protein